MAGEPTRKPRRTTLRKCTVCRGRVVRIFYGEPEGELEQKAKQGRAIIGGCFVGRPGGDPERGCLDCGARFRRGELVCDAYARPPGKQDPHELCAQLKAHDIEGAVAVARAFLEDGDLPKSILGKLASLQRGPWAMRGRLFELRRERWARFGVAPLRRTSAVGGALL